MTYKRVVTRNRLAGDYTAYTPPDYRNNELSLIAGDLRRLEQDQRDDQHLAEYARRAAILRWQAQAVLDAFFEGEF